MSISEMKILLLTDGMQPGGVERHVVHLANGLYERGVKVAVAATDGLFRGQLNPSIQFLELPLLHDGSSRKRPLGFLRTILILKKYVHDNKICIIHSHKRYTDFIARLVVSLSKFTIHLSTCHSIFTDMTWFPSFGEYTIACSNCVHQMLIELYGKFQGTVRVIHNGVPAFQKYSENLTMHSKKRLGLSDNIRIISSIGGLSKQKKPEILLQAFSYILNKCKNVHLVFVGDGPEKQRIEKLIANCGLQYYVSMLPENSVVEEIMNISNFCILSSIREGFPLVLLEAASIGKPYIATDVGGVSEFIEHNKNGILVPPNDSNALAEAISYLLNNPRKVKVLGRNAKIKYKQRFTLEKMIDEIMEVYIYILKSAG